MRLQIKHTTVFQYSESINEAYTEMRLRPLETSGQRCYRFSLSTEPRGEVMSYLDRYGNQVHHFDTLQSHHQVVVTASSDVETPQAFRPELQPLSPLDHFDFLAPTIYAPEDGDISEFARTCLVEGDAHRTTTGLMTAIYQGLQYDPEATDVRTRAPEALRLRRGVCQDFAHLMLAATRSLGIPARYVSGYLYSPQIISARRESGITVPDNAASHAWVDVFLEERGWVSLDPTHNCEQTDEYVRVATGRDYADVSPTQGVFKGSAEERLEVRVEVRAVE
ncbi:MAG: transglutaminase family protein [Blastocatellia bacterium]|jgi:transglutaminase-like putative cysteine protease